MDHKTKILFTAFIVAVLSLGLFCYYKYVLQRDYLVYTEAPCDPSAEVCFVYTCDPETEECSGNPEEDTYYYKEVRRMASQFPGCDPHGEDCLIDRCGENEVNCSISLCDPADPDSSCTLPEDFLSEELSEETVDMEGASSDEDLEAGDVTESEE